MLMSARETKARVITCQRPQRKSAGLAVRRKSFVVQPEFLIPQAGRRRNSVRPVTIPRNATSIPGSIAGR